MCMMQKFEVKENQVIIKLSNVELAISNSGGNNNLEITNYLGGSCFEAAMGYTPGNEQGISELEINL